jgi:hypothetical protein
MGMLRFLISPMGVSIVVGVGFAVWLLFYATPKHVLDYSRVAASAKTGKKKGVNEEKCRDVFQRIFGVSFESVRPSWLKSPVTNVNLELDGFNPDVETPLGRGLAFEYDGYQHEDENAHFHRGDKTNYEYQVAKDVFKTARCKKLGVLLIRIPSSVKKNHHQYILKQLRKYFVL